MKPGKMAAVGVNEWSPHFRGRTHWNWSFPMDARLEDIYREINGSAHMLNAANERAAIWRLGTNALEQFWTKTPGWA